MSKKNDIDTGNVLNCRGARRLLLKLRKKKILSCWYFIIGAPSSADLNANGCLVGVEWRIKVPLQCGREKVFITAADNLHPDEI